MVDLTGVIRGSNVLSTPLLNGASGDMNVDGSSTPVEFTYSVPEGRSYVIIGQLLLTMEIATTFDPAKFGDLTALTNGVEIIRGPQTLATWKTLEDVEDSMWELRADQGLYGLRVARGVWKFHELIGNLQGLFVNANQTFTVRVNDDLTGLSRLRMSVQGILDA